jgi:exodeoxyribonuclease V beta subunit
VSGGDLALDLQPFAGIQLIEASAGTGKTHAIAGLYLRAIVEQRLRVRDILVVTFTRAATEQLKARLRERLRACDEYARARLRGVAPADIVKGSATRDSDGQFAQVLVERALAGESAETIADLARRLHVEAISMDEAAIHTIDGFCTRVLCEQAFASGEPLDAGELVGSDLDLIEQVGADFWRLVASDPARAADFEVLRTKLGGSAQWIKLLPRLVDPALIVEPVPDTADSEAALAEALRRHAEARFALEAAWAAAGNADLDAIIAHAHSGHLSRQTHKPDKLEAWRAECRDHFAVGMLPPRGMLEKLATDRLAGRIRKHAGPLPALAFCDAVTRWLAADDALRLAFDARWPALLQTARTHATQQLDLRKQRAGRHSHDDLIRRLHAAITDAQRGARLAAALHARYPVVLVDEFQDTDARQFEIFRRLHAARPGGALVLVGDPKQAIYRFRGGDIEAYLDAARGVDATHRLACNFRSSPGLLRAIEAVFTQGDPAAAFVDPRIRFHPLAASDRAHDDDVLVDGAPIVPLTCWHLPDVPARPNKGDASAQLAAGCAEAIVGLLRKARAGMATIRERDSGARIELAPRHIAVLVATNDEAGVVQDALAARGVASATLRQESVFASEEASDMLAWLSALESHDEAGLRTALATRLGGYDARRLVELADPAQPTPWQAELHRLDALDRLWRQHGVLALFERVLETRAAALLGVVGGERRLTNYLQLAELLQAETARQFGRSGLIEWLRQRIARNDKRNEQEQLRLDSDADRVQVATIHASKGLEYDLVFLPFTALAPGASNGFPRTLEWQGDERRHVRVCSRGEQPTSELVAAAQAAEREQRGEAVRVLYVALTRARHACWLSWDAIGAGSGAALAQLWHGGAMPADSAQARDALRKLQASAASTVRVDVLPNPGTDRLVPAALAEVPPARVFDASIDASWWISSFSQLRDGERTQLADASGVDDEAGTVDAEAPAAADAGIADWPRGDRFGTAMHEILERADFAAWRDHQGATAPVAERDAIRARLRRHALAPPERETELQRVVVGLVGAALNTRLPDGAVLAALPAHARRAELPFHFAIGGADPERLIALLRQHGYQQRRAGFARAPARLCGLMTGVIDLVYRHDGRWWIIDYKTNHLGVRRADYAPAALAAAVREHDYDLQYLIYTLALHRWLRTRLAADYDYARDFGGAVYLFLRGLSRDGSHGVHVDRPPQALIEAMDALLAPGLGA